MNKYEVMFIVRPDLEESNIKSIVESMKKLVEDKNAKILEVKEMGQRELAYEINKYKMGYYYLLVIEADNNDAIAEFDRVALINENIIRHLIVKVEE